MGCRANAGDDDGYTPLMYAVNAKYSKVVKTLIKPPGEDWSNANMHQAARDGEWALTLAARPPLMGKVQVLASRTAGVSGA